MLFEDMQYLLSWNSFIVNVDVIISEIKDRFSSLALDITDLVELEFHQNYNNLL